MTKEQKPSAERDAAIARLERQLQEAQARCAKAESKLSDQSERLNALGTGREETMRVLNETRAELRRVARDRDRLQKRLTAVEDMQTETVAFPDDEEEEPGIHQAPPSIDELMVNLSAMMHDDASKGRTRLSGQSTELPDAEWHEMIPPELIAPEEFGAGKDDEAPRVQIARLLVYMNAEHAIKYPIYKETMTIGRSESADIQIDGQFISRVHARIVSTPEHAMIEDAGSKNGLKINSATVERHRLRHGDVIGIGKLSFTFVEVGPD